MMQKVLDNAGLEEVYDRMSEALDDIPASQQLLFLAKLAFALANLVGDTRQVNAAIEACKRDLQT